MKNIKDTSIDYSMRQEILKMNEDQLNLVAQAVRDRRSIINLEKKSQFVVGDRVAFSNDGTTYGGYITKINIKTIDVEVGEYTWRVSPSLLKISKGVK